MDAAYELFAQEGVHATSIEAIAEAAGFTRGAFYSNFESKNELFFALAEREWTLRLDLLRRILDEFSRARAEVGVEEQVSALLVEVFTALPDERRWSLISREFELLALREPETAPQYRAHEEEFQQQLTDVLIAAAASLGITFTLDPADVTTLLTLVHQFAVREAMLSGADSIHVATRDSMLRTIPPLLQRLTENT